MEGRAFEISEKKIERKRVRVSTERIVRREPKAKTDSGRFMLGLGLTPTAEFVAEDLRDRPLEC